MSWLFIDTHAPGSYRLGWLDRPAQVKTFQGRADDLLAKLGKVDVFRTRCTGVCVVAGPGSFSSVRLGVLQANLLSRLLGVPLVGISVDEAKDLDALCFTLHASRFTTYVAPIYDAEPNITVKRET